MNINGEVFVDDREIRIETNKQSKRSRGLPILNRGICTNNKTITQITKKTKLSTNKIKTIRIVRTRKIKTRQITIKVKTRKIFNTVNNTPNNTVICEKKNPIVTSQKDENLSKKNSIITQNNINDIKIMDKENSFNINNKDNNIKRIIINNNDKDTKFTDLNNKDKNINNKDKNNKDKNNKDKNTKFTDLNNKDKNNKDKNNKDKDTKSSDLNNKNKNNKDKNTKSTDLNNKNKNINKDESVISENNNIKYINMDNKDKNIKRIIKNKKEKNRKSDNIDNKKYIKEKDIKDTDKNKKKHKVQSESEKENKGPNKGLNKETEINGIKNAEMLGKLIKILKKTRESRKREEIKKKKGVGNIKQIRRGIIKRNRRINRIINRIIKKRREKEKSDEIGRFGRNAKLLGIGKYSREYLPENKEIEKVILYILKCTNNKYYIGKSRDFCKRLIQHSNGKGAEWTKKYKPIQVEEIYISNNGYDEDDLTLKTMKKYGIKNVRGGSFVQCSLENIDAICIKKLLKHQYDHISPELKYKLKCTAYDMCFNCGSYEHFGSNCIK